MDMGEHGWRHPDLEGLTYQSKEHCIADAKRKNSSNFGLVHHIDTRPTISEAARYISDEENGAWTEGGVHVFPGINPLMRWPDGRIMVFVQSGASEGLYLNVRVKDWSPATSESMLLLIGKTLDCSADSWYRCWMSAARIARMLGA